MLLYKGAGPGTHWSIHDPAQAGGFPTARGVANLHSFVRHIVNYSWPSQHTSLIRDAEVLARRRVPRTCIVNRYLVY